MIAAAGLLALALLSAAPAQDNDRDGWAEDEDCDDAEDRVNPGEVEDCGDGLDNDCDSYVDDLDADCHPDSGGCSAAPVGGVVSAALAGLALSGRRRRGRPAPSSPRCRG